jgi:hypothetical protein
LMRGPSAIGTEGRDSPSRHKPAVVDVAHLARYHYLTLPNRPP